MLYLDQSDLSNLALARPGTAQHRERDRLIALARSGVVRLRISVAHLAETARMSWRKVWALNGFMLRQVPDTSFARLMPGEIIHLESRGTVADLGDTPAARLGTLEILRVGLSVGYAGPYAEAMALSKNSQKSFIRFFRARPPRTPALEPSVIKARPAHAVTTAIYAAGDRDLRRSVRSSDTMDAMHATYAVYSDVATLDGHVLNVTEGVRRHLSQPPHFHRTGRVREVLDFVEDHYATGGR